MEQVWTDQQHEEYAHAVHQAASAMPLSDITEVEEESGTLVHEDSHPNNEVVSYTEEHAHPQNHLKSYRYVVGLKEREDIAKAAYKTWFRLKVGNKEIKDRWWALYYKKLHPKYQLRDNHLGRQINSWIEEDLRNYRKAQAELMVSGQVIGADDGSQALPSLEQPEADPPVKKRKANSSKEGTVPAYLNVELVHPSPELMKLTPDMGYHIVENSPEYYALKLKEFCVDGSIDWNDFVLEEDIIWFKTNRTEIMDKIPTLSGRNKNIGVVKSPNGQPAKPTPKGKKQLKQQALVVRPARSDNADWINADMYHADNAIWVKMDLPNLIPGEDFVVQCDDQNHLMVKGEKRSEMLENSSWAVLHQSRAHGKFSYEIDLPVEANTSVPDVVFQSGVLTIRFPIRERGEWRILPIITRDDESIVQQ